MIFDQSYWENRYNTCETGWDVGVITQPIKDYFDQVRDKNAKILIPGCGYGHEAEYLWKAGFTNVFVIDISEIPLKNLHKRVPDFPQSQLIQGDFFDLEEREFDYIIEQTFFCALEPSLRERYAKKMHELLRYGGKLAGVLFNDKLNSDKPPFGGNKEEYISYFGPLFQVKYFDTCYNSILPRAGRELFICLVKS